MEKIKNQGSREPVASVDKQGDQNFWYLFFTLIFLLVVLVLGWMLGEVNGGLPQEITLSGAALVVLATFRLTQLLVYDKIVEPFRSMILVRGKEGVEGDTVRLYEPQAGPRRALWHLVNCPWCAGMWFAPIVVFFYYLSELAWIAIFVLAVAGVASVFQIFVNFLGWSAKKKKLEVKERE